MDLKSGYPYWAIKNGLMTAFPALRGDVHCDVAIVGGGITAALIARELAMHGHDVCVLEQRDIAWGSTAASTALLQYEIDVHFLDLAKRHGDENAALAYRACAAAIEQLRDVAREVRDVGFAQSDSLYYASRRRHVRVLQAEGAARRRIGLDSRWLDGDEVRARYGMDVPGALLTSQAARVDPYRMASRLFQRLERDGASIFDRSVVHDIDASPRRVVLHTETGARVTAKYAVLAAGYATQRWLDKPVARNRSSYAFISDPLEDGELDALADTIMWETARPYLYLRTTEDKRVLVGGEDDATDVPKRRDRRVESKAKRLQKRASELLPYLPAITPAFSWAGTFAETDDGLPYFGPHPKYGPRVLFAMAYGGNGITYSMLGGALLRARIERRAHPLATLFGFGRRPS